MTKLLDVKEAAAMLKTTRQQVRKMIRDNLIPAVKVGREWRISEEYLDSFLEENMR